MFMTASVHARSTADPRAFLTLFVRFVVIIRDKSWRMQQIVVVGESRRRH